MRPCTSPQIIFGKKTMNDEVLRGSKLKFAKCLRDENFENVIIVSTITSFNQHANSTLCRYFKATIKGAALSQRASKNFHTCFDILILILCLFRCICASEAVFVQSNQPRSQAMLQPNLAPLLTTSSTTERFYATQMEPSLNDYIPPVLDGLETARIGEQSTSATKTLSETPNEFKANAGNIFQQGVSSSENGARAMKGDLVSKVIHKATKTKHKTHKKLHKLFHKTVHKVGHAFHQKVHSVHG